MSIVLGITTFLLILVALFLILVILAQKAKSDGGLGAAMGGGMAEAAFGAETSNVLSTLTRNATILFFVLTFALYLGRIYERKQVAHAAGSALPDITAPASPLPGADLAVPLAVPPVPSGIVPPTAPATEPVKQP